MELDERLQHIRDRMFAACELAKRDPSEVMLLPVSKNHTAESVRELTYHQCRVFGENRVQEAKLKISACTGISCGISSAIFSLTNAVMP